MYYAARRRGKKSLKRIEEAVLAGRELFGSSVFDVIDVPKVGTVRASEAVGSVANTLYVAVASSCSPFM